MKVPYTAKNYLMILPQMLLVGEYQELINCRSMRVYLEQWWIQELVVGGWGGGGGGNQKMLK